MADKKWAEETLRDFQKIELTEIARVKKAEDALKAAKSELFAAKESLKGIRGCIAEMTWQLDYCKEHGQLP
jgi:citrate lyase synthetase